MTRHECIGDLYSVLPSDSVHTDDLPTVLLWMGIFYPVTFRFWGRGGSHCGDAGVGARIWQGRCRVLRGCWWEGRGRMRVVGSGLQSIQSFSKTQGLEYPLL